MAAPIVSQVKNIINIFGSYKMIDCSTKLLELSTQNNEILTELFFIILLFRDLEVEEQISRIVNQSYDLDKFNNQAYRRKLIEMLKGFREGFINDMTDYNGISGNRQGILSDINGETT